MEKYGKTAVFSRPATAGFGKYCTGSYGRIGVYRVNKLYEMVPFYRLNTMLGCRHGLDYQHDGEIMMIIIVKLSWFVCLTVITGSENLFLPRTLDLESHFVQSVL